VIEVLYDAMVIPESCQLGKRVYKKLIQENAKLGATDKIINGYGIDLCTISASRGARFVCFRFI